MFKASLATSIGGVSLTRSSTTVLREPPILGVPPIFRDKSLAWTTRTLQPWQCVSCGRPQAEHLERKDIQALLCSRCAMILADASPEAEDPLSPEDRAAFTHRNRRRETRQRRAK